MKQLVICAVLGISALDPAAMAAEGGLPWKATATATGAYLRTEEGSAREGLQMGIYEGISFKPLRQAWFHAGMLSRTTDLPGSRSAYLEPLSMKLGGTGILMRDLLYLTLGASLPLSARKIALEDSSAMRDFLEEPSPLFQPDILPENLLFLALQIKQLWLGQKVLFGFQILQPGLLSLYDDGSLDFQPARILAFHASTSWMLESRLHSLDARLLVPGSEMNRSEVAAHQEGLIMQVRYGWRMPTARGGLELAGGLKWQGSDQSRRFLIPGPLVRHEENNNVQHVYSELHWAQPQSSNAMMQFFAIPSYLFRSRTGELEHGLRLQGGMDLGFRFARRHRIQVEPSLLHERLGERSDWGGSLRLTYSWLSPASARHGLFPQPSSNR